MSSLENNNFEEGEKAIDRKIDRERELERGSWEKNKKREKVGKLSGLRTWSCWAVALIAAERCPPVSQSLRSIRTSPTQPCIKIQNILFTIKMNK